MTKTERLKSFDLLKLFTIFLVIWGHCIQYLLSSDYLDEPVYRIIYTFHMPLFMMISGYFAYSSMFLSVKPFLIKKIKTLILPIISWNIVSWFILDCILNLLQGEKMSCDGLWLMFRHNFWFLKSCFICYCITYIGFNSGLKKCLWIPFAVFISFFIPYQMYLMYPAFIVGILLRSDNKFRTFVYSHFYLLFIVFIVQLIFINKSFWLPHGIRSFIMKSDYILLSHYLFIILYRIIIGLVGSLMFIRLFDVVCDKIKCINRIPIIEWGQYTLEIYILQTFILEQFISSFLKLDNMEFIYFNFVVSPVISFVVLTLCVLIAKMLHKSKVLSLILFGK